MNVYAINGIALSGKDSFVNRVIAIAQKDNQIVVSISTVDPIKKMYSQYFGWNGDKSDVHRKNLNNLKKAWIDASNGPMVWVDQQFHYLQMKRVHSVFVMVREFDEMMGIIEVGKKFGKAKTVCILRPGIPIPPVEQEFLDSHPENYMYDITVMNKTTDDMKLPVLWKSAGHFWESES